MLLSSNADLFQNYFIQKFISGAQSEFQTVWIQIRTDTQTVCEGYQQMTLVGKKMKES